MKENKIYLYWLVFRFFDDDMIKLYHTERFSFDQSDLKLNFGSNTYDLSDIITITDNGHVLFCDQYLNEYLPYYRKIVALIKSQPNDTHLCQIQIKGEGIIFFH